ncbi:MAG TPA: hypothetical protein VGK39_05815 [Cyclobacteriaceae bacterium]
MKMMKYLMFLLLVGATLTFTSCSDDDDPKEDSDDIIADQNDVDLDVDDLNGAITGDITLSANEDWLLTSALVVKEGGSLTIEAGTTILAEAGGTDVYIAVERGAQIFVNGTSTNPVTITSAATAPASGDWGGLMVMGHAPITGGNTAVTEVVDFFYGGSNATDDSGDITYLILEYTGARINGEKEFNGLTLYGVGSGTTVNNVSISDGDDDGIEFFGGTVNVSNILVIDAKDDMFDWTQGYIGTITNAYGIRQSGFTDVTSDPRGIEADGNLDGLTPAATPQSNATVTNITFVNNSTAVITDFIKIRRNSSATVTNALIIQGTSAPAPGDVVDYDDAAGVAAASTTVNVSLSGTNLDPANIDNTGTAGTIATITFPGTANTGANTAAFAWTGFAF